MNILILGGTKNARIIAEKLSDKHNVYYSIAGATQAPQLPKIENIITGGFGGILGLVKFLEQNEVDICIDATHPFATQISTNVIAATRLTNVSLYQFMRKIWDVDIEPNWREFEDADSIISALPATSQVLLAIGSKHIAQYFSIQQSVIARMIEQPDLKQTQLPRNLKIMLKRPPYAYEEEFELLTKNKITHIICKNSGGELDAKIRAAKALNLNVFMLKQPETPAINRYFKIEELLQAIKVWSLTSTPSTNH